MHCYKCSSPNNLSIKKNTPLTFICRPCRNQMQKHYNSIRQPKEPSEDLEWTLKAQKSHQKVLEKYGVCKYAQNP